MNKLEPPASHWICPICQHALVREERQYRCANGHCFDVAKEGYLNLLPANRKHSSSPGDDRQMLRNRREFLERGHYRALAERLAEACATEHRRLSGHPFALLDTGCGEGYYTGLIAEDLQGTATDVWIGGIDIAKDAVRMAAKRYPGIDFAVASTVALPVADASLDLITRIFAPGTDSEVCRTLRPGGLLILVTPGPRHLYQLRELVYDSPRGHPADVVTVEGLQHEQRTELDFELQIEGAGDVARLLTMTPYYWQADQDKQARIAALPGLHTEVSFRIDCYRRPTRISIDDEPGHPDDKQHRPDDVSP
jgi:23S rRNA (guanine745-N1)-methyltransferase